MDKSSTHTCIVGACERGKPASGCPPSRPVSARLDALIGNFASVSSASKRLTHLRPPLECRPYSQPQAAKLHSTQFILCPSRPKSVNSVPSLPRRRPLVFCMGRGACFVSLHHDLGRLYHSSCLVQRHTAAFCVNGNACWPGEFCFGLDGCRVFGGGLATLGPGIHIGATHLSGSCLHPVASALH